LASGLLKGLAGLRASVGLRRPNRARLSPARRGRRRGRWRRGRCRGSKEAVHRRRRGRGSRRGRRRGRSRRSPE